MHQHALVFGSVVLPGLLPNVALAVLRVFAGSAMAFAHGIKKLPPSEGFINGVDAMGFPLPIVFAWVAALSEFFGASLVALGLATRPAALFVTCTMSVAAFIRHGADEFQKQEMSLLYGAVFLLFTILGAGRLSIDSLIRKP